VILEQYYLGCLAHASYLIADEASGQAAVIDPQRDVGQYLDDAALETPGHSQESISILVFDPAHGMDEPYAVLTGDTLFIGDVGRPDL
jgi:glyoxylase-like metal-dependent hydrolase (beta-lactamase superfamily II)